MSSRSAYEKGCIEPGQAKGSQQGRTDQSRILAKISGDGKPPCSARVQEVEDDKWKPNVGEQYSAVAVPK